MDALTFLTLPPRTAVMVERKTSMPAYYHAECLAETAGWKLWLDDIKVSGALAGFVCIQCGYVLERNVKWMR